MGIDPELSRVNALPILPLKRPRSLVKSTDNGFVSLTKYYPH